MSMAAAPARAAADRVSGETEGEVLATGTAEAPESIPDARREGAPDQKFSHRVRAEASGAGVFFSGADAGTPPAGRNSAAAWTGGSSELSAAGTLSAAETAGRADGRAAEADDAGNAPVGEGAKGGAIGVRASRGGARTTADGAEAPGSETRERAEPAATDAAARTCPDAGMARDAETKRARTALAVRMSVIIFAAALDGFSPKSHAPRGIGPTVKRTRRTPMGARLAVMSSSNNESRLKMP
jgi:hypothetical protein